MTTTHFPPPLGRATAAVIALALAGAAFAATPAVAARTYTLSVSSPAILTLPAGDGFNDRTTVTLRSNGAISAKVGVYDSHRHLVKTLAKKVTLTRVGFDYRARVAIPVESLAAGRYTVRASRTVDGARLVDAASLTIGSGRARTAALKRTVVTLFPFEDGYRDTVRATITARDETGTVLPTTGTLLVDSAQHSATRRFTRSDGEPASVSLDATDFPTGRATVRASVAGPAGHARTTKPLDLVLRATRVTAVATTRDVATVYPSADGYRDSVALTVKTSSSTGHRIAVRESVAITRNGVTVREWKASSSRTAHYRWNGRVHGRIVPGSYLVTTTALGPEGTTKTATTRITVSAKKLHTETLTYRRDASGVLTNVQSFDRARRGDCAVAGAAVTCTGLTSDPGYAWSLATWGQEPVPAVVRASEGYRVPSIRVWIRAGSLAGKSQWSAGGAQGRHAGLAAGTHSLGWITLDPHQSTTAVSVSLRDRSKATIQQLRFDYRYAVLE